METVFGNGLMEKEVKLCLYSVDLHAKGEVRPFFKQISYRKQLPETFAFL